MYRFSFAFLFLLACVSDLPSDSAEINSDSGLTDVDTLALLNIPDSAVVVPAEFVTAEIRITWSGSYCNGAYPSDEMLEEIRTPRPLNEIKIVLKGEKNYNLTTDYRGRITVDLVPGNYELFLDRGNDPEEAPFNVNCKKYYERTWGSLKVESDELIYKIHIEFPCDLCDDTIKRRP